MVRRLGCEWVFVNPKTGSPWSDIRKMFTKACEEAGLSGAWFHDQRRSFVTKARRSGVAESVVMKMSGHRTRAVFDRYNIVEDEDVREGVRRIEAALTQCAGHDLVKVAGSGPGTTKAPEA